MATKPEAPVSPVSCCRTALRVCVCVRATLHHAPVCGVCNGIDVWRHLVSLFSLVHVDDLLRVDGQVFIRVNDHTEQARVCLHNF